MKALLFIYFWCEGGELFSFWSHWWSTYYGPVDQRPDFFFKVLISCISDTGCSFAVLPLPLLPRKDQDNSAGVYRCKRIPPTSCSESPCFSTWFSSSMQQVGNHCSFTARRNPWEDCVYAERHGEGFEAILWIDKCKSRYSRTLVIHFSFSI